MASLSQRYQLIRNLTQSAVQNSQATLAKDTITGNLVVVKELRYPDATERDRAIQSYQTLLQRLQPFSSAQIVNYSHVQPDSDRFHLVRDYLPHRSLAQVTSLSYLELQRLTARLLEILLQLQQRDRDLQHGNLKPTNIFIDAQGNLQLTDFAPTATHPSQELSAIALTLLSVWQPPPVEQRSAPPLRMPPQPLHPEAENPMPDAFRDWLEHLLHLDQHSDYSLRQAQADLQRLTLTPPEMTEMRALEPRSRSFRQRLWYWFTRTTQAPAPVNWILFPSGEPTWTEAEFQELLVELGNAGYGWLDPEAVRRQLEILKKQRRVE